MPPRYLMHPRRLPALFALGAALVLGSSCDVRGIVCPAEPITVEVNSSNTLAPNTARADVRNVTRPGGTLPAILRVPSIEIDQLDIAFQGTGSGTVKLALVVDGYLATLGTLTIANGALTGFAPTSYTVGAFSQAEAQAMIDALSSEDRTRLNLRDLNGLTQAAIQEGVNNAIRQANFPVGVMTVSDGNAHGSVQVSRVTFHVGC